MQGGSSDAAVSTRATVGRGLAPHLLGFDRRKRRRRHLAALSFWARPQAPSRPSATIGLAVLLATRGGSRRLVVVLAAPPASSSAATAPIVASISVDGLRWCLVRSPGRRPSLPVLELGRAARAPAIARVLPCAAASSLARQVLAAPTRVAVTVEPSAARDRLTPPADRLRGNLRLERERPCVSGQLLLPNPSLLRAGGRRCPAGAAESMRSRSTVRGDAREAWYCRIAGSVEAVLQSS